MFTSLLHAGSYAFSLYGLIMLGTGLSTAGLGITIVQRERGSRISWWFFALSMTVFWWLIARAMTASSSNAELAEVWARAAYLAMPLMPVALLQFAYVAVGGDREPRPLLVAGWSLGAILAALSATTDSIIRGVWRFPWGFYPRFGHSAVFFISFLIVLALAAVYTLVRAAARLPRGRQRSRLRHFAIANVAGFLGCVDFLGAYGVAIVPFGHLAVLGSMLITARAIRRYRLFDITPAFAAANILSTIPDGLFVVDDEGKVRIVNEAGCALTGLTRFELIGSPLLPFLPSMEPGDQELCPQGGTPIPVTVSLTNLSNGAQRAGMVVVVRDARERRRIEAALREKEFRLRLEEVRQKAELQYGTLVESMNEGLIQLDPDFAVRYINSRAAEMIGCTREALTGFSIANIGDTPLRELLVTMTEQLRRDIRDHYEIQVRSRAGDVRWLDITGSLVVDTDGEALGTLGVLNDVTARRLVEEQLAASAKEWQETFDAIRMPIMILDRNARLQRANRATRELAGVEEGESVVARPVSDFGPDALWKEVDRLARTVERSERVQFEESPGGATWDIVVDVVESDAPDGLIVVSVRDDTPLVQLQLSLRRSETMSALGHLVGGVAHEVRNPLFAISATLDAFERRHGDRDEYRVFAAVMHEQIDRLSALMSGLLEFGRVAPAMLELAPMTRVIGEAINLCRADAILAGVEIVSKGPGTESFVRSDERRLVQAFRNLVDNALQHSPRGGSVTVNWILEELGNELRVICTVTDEGPGFAPGDVARVFEPFFTQRRGGTGLGLSITRAVVDQHHGRIVAANRSEGGAIMTVELPATVLTLAPGPAPEPQKQRA